MAERYVSFRMGKETSLGSEVAPSNSNPFMDGTFVFAYNDKYNHFDSSDQIVDGRLYIDATIDGNNYRFPVNSECSYFLINKEDGTDYAVGDENSPIYFANGIPQIIDCVKTQAGGTGLKSFTANRMVWTSSTSALSTSKHYVDANHLAVNSETLPSYNFYVNGTSAMTNILTFISATATNNKITTSSGSMYYASASTTYIDSGSNSSLIFRPQGTEQARFNTSGQLQIKATGAANATVIGPAKAGTFYFPNSGGTFVTHATRGTAVGGTAKPVYIATTGRATALSATVGSSTLPVYLNSGAITACSTTLDVSITGNAASSTYATNVRVTLTNPTSDTTYYPVWTSGTSSETNYELRNNNGIKYMTLEGTADSIAEDETTKSGTNGYGMLILGNDVASGTAANKYGSIRMYGTSTSYISYRPFNNTSSYTRYLVGTSSSASVGSATQPVYISSTGTITACTSYANATVGTANKLGTATVGSGVKPIYLNAGTATASTSTVGSITTPTYLKAGTITVCNMAAPGDWWDALPFIREDGVMEIGRYIDFHTTDTGKTDYDYRLTATTSDLTGSGSLTASTYIYSKTYFRTANYGTGNPGSSTAGHGVTGALYFKIIS